MFRVRPSALFYRPIARVQPTITVKWYHLSDVVSLMFRLILTARAIALRIRLTLKRIRSMFPHRDFTCFCVARVVITIASNIPIVIRPINRSVRVLIFPINVATRSMLNIHCTRTPRVFANGFSRRNVHRLKYVLIYRIRQGVMRQVFRLTSQLIVHLSLRAPYSNNIIVLSRILAISGPYLLQIIRMIRRSNRAHPFFRVTRRVLSVVLLGSSDGSVVLPFGERGPY